MANDHKHGEMDIAEQERTYDLFMSWVVWGVVVIIGVLLLLAIFAT